jgi:TolB-like protein
MASLLPGFSYDIFISYRQKDNKYDGWVTEFVDHLKKELEATFKEDVGVYFDINPHDGLLETYDVDASLKDKLKCLIFIPIISRTYCDPKSFAWEHEFKAFVEQVSQDPFGLKVKLPNGNVASRVLPIRIYDIDDHDIKLCESILGGFLRSVDFIYKSAGVNRPLRANEDHPQDNLNKTYYRDQINKVANSISEIIGAIGQQNPDEEKVPGEIFKPTAPIPKKKKTPIIAGSLMVMVLIILGIFLVPKLFKSDEKATVKSIAVLPFKLLGNEPDMQYQADGMMDAILMHLSRIKELRVRDRTSVEQYRQTTKNMNTIGRELDVNYILEGSFQKYGDHVRLIVQLINAGEGDHLWANEYDKKWDEVFAIQSEVARIIAGEIHVSLSPGEMKTITTPPTSDLMAYDYYLKGIDYRQRSYQEEDIRNAIGMFEKAVEIDPDFTLAWVGLSGSYRSLYWFGHEKIEKINSMAKKYLDNATALDPGLKEVKIEEAWYYYQIRHDLAKSAELLEKLRSGYPHDGYLIYSLSVVYRRMHENEKALELIGQAISIEPSNWQYWYLGATLWSVLGQEEKSEQYTLKALVLNPSNLDVQFSLFTLYSSTGQIQKARELLNQLAKTADLRNFRWGMAHLAYKERNFDQAIQFMDSLNEEPFHYQHFYYTKHLQLGIYYLAKHDTANAMKQFAMERDFLVRKIKENGDDWRLYESLATAFAGLGMKDEALGADDKAREILASSKNVFMPEYSNLIEILVIVGEYEEAINQLKKMKVSLESLKLDPFWDPLRNHPKFKEIVNNPK